MPSMSDRTEERREFQRLDLPEPLSGHFAGRPVEVVDLGVLGARLQHSGPLDIDEGVLAFECDGRLIEFECGVVRTMETAGRHQSGLRFYRAISDSDQILRAMLSELASREIEARKTSAGPAIEFEQSEPTRMEAPFVTFRMDDNIWLRRPAFTPRQPENGFTLPAGGEEIEIRRLCLSYAAGDEEARRLVRLFAELSVSAEIGVPPRS